MSHSESTSSTRRAFLVATGIGAAAAITGLPLPARSAEPSDVEKANIDVVNRFCADWANRDGSKLGEYFADNATFRMSEDAPAAQGKEVIAKRFGAFLAMSQEANFEMIRTYAIGNIVVNERIDHFTMGPKKTGYHMSGVFFVKDGKIQEWLDYRMPKPKTAEEPAAK